MVNKVFSVSESWTREVRDSVVPIEGMTLFENSYRDVVIFAKYMLGVELYSWQVVALRKVQAAIDGGSDQRVFNLLTSRQIGKSTLLQVLALWVTLFNKRPVGMHKHTAVSIISASDKQAKSLVRKVRMLMFSGERFMHRRYNGKFTDRDGKFFSLLIDPSQPNNTEQITFKPYSSSFGEWFLRGSQAGSYIQSFPPTSGVLGETVSFIFVDEAAKYDKITDEFYFEELKPIGNRADAININTSTPWAPVGFFYKLCDPEGLYGSTAEVIAFDIDAIKFEEDPEAQQQYASVMADIAKDRAMGEHDGVLRKYYCQFVKGEANYFDPDKVREVFDESFPMVEHTYLGEVDIGIDFGGTETSETVVTVSRFDPDSGAIERLFHKVYSVMQDRTLLSDLENLVFPLFPNWNRIIYDKCPAAQYIEQEMEYRGWNIHPMSFRSDKVRKYSAFRSKLNKGLVRSYVDDALREEMLSLEGVQGTQNTMIRAPRGMSDDRIDSFIMSAYFMVQEESSFKVVRWDEW